MLQKQLINTVSGPPVPPAHLSHLISSFVDLNPSNQPVFQCHYYHLLILLHSP
jgi:hypothetical protein